MSLRYQMRYMNPYELHKLLINDYILKKPGDTRKLNSRETAKDKTDIDVIRENHRFLWDEDTPATWEKQFARKYYDKLFKEYCIGDLSLYKENKIALRWRTQLEVVSGKGQFSCGNKKCGDEENLKTWEVNFAYREQGEKKNALVKIRLCPDCSKKLNYHSKKREVKRLSRKSHKSKSREKDKTTGAIEDNSERAVKHSNEDMEGENSKGKDMPGDDASPWQQHNPVEVKSRDDEMEEYLEDLLL